MAITRAQQYKQMLQNGGMLVQPGFGGTRQGYRGDDAARSSEGTKGGRADPGNAPRGDGPARSGPTNNQVDTGDLGSEEANVKTNIAANLGGSGTSDPIESVNKLRNFLNTRPTVKRLPPIGPFGIATNLFNKQFQRFSDFSTKKNRDFFQKVIGAGRLNLGGKTIDLETVGQMTDEELEDTYRDYLSARANNEIDAFGNPITKTGDGPEELIIPLQDTSGIMNVADKPEEEEIFTPNLRLLAEGGMADLDREAFFLGGIAKGLKKVTRAVKKIAKSPVGKLAIGAAILGTPFGAGAKGTGFFGSKSLFGRGLGFIRGMGVNKALLETSDYQGGPTGILDLIRKNPLLAIGGASALAGLYTGKTEDDEEELYAGADIDDPRTIMANPYNYLNIRNMAEGGSTEKEPVAKKTMPLLDMDCMEKDYREEGGFVPIGRMEKADDVPARLSKNEFVFTADAVRNAGDGDVDKGAEVMYNMMKNLESGGDVSEESQGLEGAREMFQTSKRLEEVL